MTIFFNKYTVEAEIRSAINVEDQSIRKNRLSKYDQCYFYFYYKLNRRVPNSSTLIIYIIHINQNEERAAGWSTGVDRTNGQSVRIQQAQKSIANSTRASIGNREITKTANVFNFRGNILFCKIECQ